MCSMGYELIKLVGCLVGFVQICCLAHVSLASLDPVSPIFHHSSRRMFESVPSAPLILRYDSGPLLTGPVSINVYILWYGKFSPAQKAPISEFFSSLHHHVTNISKLPSVRSWWANLKDYRDSSHAGVASSARIAKQASDMTYSVGKSLKRSSMGNLLRMVLLKKVFPRDPKGIYMVLTADDVSVERFCMDSCGFHDSVRLSRGRRVLLAWVGNSALQCPGLCAWPFAAPPYGPPNQLPLIPPNGDVGVDGMIINIATVLAGIASNPFHTGYYQGSGVAPLEAVTACAGIFGKDGYPGYPGELLVNRRTNSSYNAYGINKRTFLLPAMWNPSTLSCKTTLS